MESIAKAVFLYAGDQQYHEKCESNRRKPANTRHRQLLDQCRFTAVDAVQSARYTDPMLAQCWAIVSDTGPALNQLCSVYLVS